VSEHTGAEARRPPGPSTRRKVVALLLTAVLTAAVPALWFAWSAVGDVADEIEDGRLRLAQLAATQADRVVVEAFYEVELMAQELAVEQSEASLASQADALREIRGRGASFHSGVVLLDGRGDRVAVEPAQAFNGIDIDDILRAAGTAPDRAVSVPWLDTQSGHAMAALSVPLYAPDGTRAATVAGIMDLAAPLISDLIVPAARLGPSGHADLVDERGLVLASTEPGHVLTAGDHPDFYRSAATVRSPQVDRAAHISEPGDPDPSEWHIMAYAPLQNAPWGVAMGANEEETLEPVRRLQNRLLAVAFASALTLLLGIGLAVRWIPRRSDQ
jgi:hypothetical protein